MSAAHSKKTEFQRKKLHNASSGSAYLYSRIRLLALKMQSNKNLTIAQLSDQINGYETNSQILLNNRKTLRFRKHFTSLDLSAKNSSPPVLNKAAQHFFINLVFYSGTTPIHAQFLNLHNYI